MPAEQPDALRRFFTYFLLAIAWLNPFAVGPLAAMMPWLVSLACVAAVALLQPRRDQEHTAPSGIPAFLGVWAAIALYFFLQLLRTGVRPEGLAGLVACVCVGLMAWMGTFLVQNQQTGFPGGVRTLGTTWLVVALVSCVFAFLQYLQLADWFAPWISASHDGAAFANLRQRNQFATLCGIGLLALLYLQQRADVQPKPVAWPWLGVALLALGNGLSSSRTGALQWLLIAVAVLCWRTSLHRKVV